MDGSTTGDAVDAPADLAIADATADLGTDAPQDTAIDDAAPDVDDAGPEDACVGQICNGVCIDTRTDPANCGSCGNVCLGASWDPGRCVASVCDPLSPPRPIAPLSTSRSSSWRPTFRWELAPGTTGAVVELCSDRACTSPQRSDVDGTTFRPVNPLTPGVWFWRLRARTSGGEGTRWSPVWQFTVGHRDAPVATTSGTILDVNGDGFADVALASGRETRQFWIYPGAMATIPSDFAQTAIVGDPASVRSNSDGSVLRSAGDVNGDGFGDLLLAESSAVSAAGRVYVLYGSLAGIDAARSTTLHGRSDAANDLFGVVVSSVGDVNGDGYADVGIAATGADSRNGVFDLFLGGPDGLPASPSEVVPSPDSMPTSAAFGVVIAGMGDVDADGYDDLVVGSTARLHLFHGSADGVVPTPVTALNDPMSAGSYPFKPATSGDYNADGYLDLSVATLISKQVEVFMGGSDGPSSTPTLRLTVANPSTQSLEQHLDGSGDLDGDGYADLVIVGSGEFGSDTNQGTATVVYRGGAGGPETLPSAVIFLRNGVPFLNDTAFAGDMDGDGYDDVVTGQAAGNLDSVAGPGHAFLYRGGAGGLVTPAAAVWTSPDPNESEFGAAVALPVWHGHGLAGGR